MYKRTISLILIASAIVTVVAFVVWLRLQSTVSQQSTSVTMTPATKEKESRNRLLRDVDRIGSQPEEHPLTIGAGEVQQEEDLRLHWERIGQLVGDEKEPVHVLHDVGDHKSIDKECVGLLRNLLLNESYKNRWNRIAAVLLQICDKYDEATLQSVLNYIKRDDVWSKSESQFPSEYLYGKAQVLQFIGLLKCDLALDTLRDTFTEEGARALIAEWIDEPRPADSLGYEKSQVVINDFRGLAAMGLVITRDPPSIAIVRDSLESFVHETQSSRYLERKFEEDVELDMGLYAHLVSAMVTHEIIVDIGLESYLKELGTEQGVQRGFQYAFKYTGEFDDDGKIVVTPCPICERSAQ